MTSSPTSNNWIRRHPRITGVAMFLVLAWVALKWSALRSRRQLEKLETETWTRIRAMGYPTSNEEWAAKFPSIPDSSNAFVELRPVLDRMTSQNSHMYYRVLSKTNADVVGVVDKLPSEYSADLDLIARCRLSDSYVNDWSTPGGYPPVFLRDLQLQKIVDRFCARSLRRRATDPELGFADLTNAMRVIGWWTNSPSVLVAIRVQEAVSTVQKATEEFIGQRPLSLEQLLSLDVLLDGNGPSISPSMAFERIHLAILTQKAFSSSSPAKVLMPRGVRGSILDTFRLELPFWILEVSGRKRRDLSLILSTVEGLVGVTHLAIGNRLNSLKRIRAEWDVQSKETPFEEKFGMAPVTRTWGMIYPELWWPEFDNIAIRRCLRAAVAIERYRLDHQMSLPSSLNSLVPEYAKEIMVDPFDEKPLRYQVLTNGYRIYSIGKDLKDEGGMVAPYYNNRSEIESKDPGVEIRR